MDIATIKYELNKMRNGANVHTINKALSYLGSFESGAWFLKDEDERQALLKSHLHNCENAIRRNDVSVLKYLMRKWF